MSSREESPDLDSTAVDNQADDTSTEENDELLGNTSTEDIDEELKDLEMKLALQNEIVVSQAILGEDCTRVSGKPPKIRLKLFRPYSEDMGHEERGVSAQLFVCFLPGYPKTCPKLEIEPGQGLTKAIVDDLLSLLQETLNELEGESMILSLHEAANKFLSNIISSSRDLAMVHLLRLACSSSRELAAAFTQISSELHRFGVFTRRALDFSHQPLTVFYQNFDRDLSEQKASSSVPLFWKHAELHSRYFTDFEQIKSLGSGAYGHVKCCKNKVDGRLYAVKRIRLRGDNPHDQVLREVNTLSSLQHPNIVRYFQAWFETGFGRLDSSDSGTAESEDLSDTGARDDFVGTADDFAGIADGSDGTLDGSASIADGSDGTLDGSASIAEGFDGTEDGSTGTADGSTGTEETKLHSYLYIQMEYCPEGNLREFLDSRNERLEETHAWALSRQIAAGLKHVHENGIIHRDIKPANIFFDAERNNVKIGDFGLAKFLEVEQLDTGRGGTPNVGTGIYIAPEIVTQSKESKPIYDEKADIYSFGVVFFELWHPFGTRMERAMILSDLEKTREAPTSWVVQFPKQSEILKLLISANPSERPCAGVLLELLENAARV